MATSTLAGAAMSLSYPLLSLVLEENGVDAATIGWSAAGYGLGVLVGAPFYGPLITRLRPTGAMRAGLALAALIILLLPLHVDPLTWFFARILIGAASALVFVISEAAVNALADESRRSRILGLYATFFCVGYAVGPLIVAAVGAQGWLPFIIGAAFLIAGMIPASLAHGADEALSGGAASFNFSRLRLVAVIAPLPLFAVFVFGLIESGQFALLPIYGLAAGIDARATGVMLSVWIAGNILFQVPVGWLADRWSRHGMLLAMTLTSAILALGLPLVMHDPVLLWPVMLVMGATMGALYTLSLSLLGERFRGADLTMANTAFIIMIQTGTMLGPAIGGTSMRLLGFEALMPTFALFLAILFLATIMLRRHEKP